MDTVHFLGRVVPPGFSISIGYDPKITWNEPSLLSFVPTFIIHVKESAVDVECQVEKFEAVQYVPLFIRAFDLARASVDLVAFSTGYCLTTVFEFFIHPDGTREPLRHGNADVASLCTALKLNAPKSYDELYKIVVSDFELFMTLRDLIEANTTPHMVAINCGRVLDGIKRMIAPGAADQKKAWSAMQTALNISRPYQEWVTKLSANPRHADRSYIAGDTSVEALKRTWQVMNRFLEYKKRGNNPLGVPDFPPLV